MSSISLERRKNWRAYYDSVKCSPVEALDIIKDGDHVTFGHNVCEPQTMIDTIVENASRFHNVTIHHMQTMGKGEYTKPEYKDNLHFDGWFLSPGTRYCVAEGYGDVTPNHYYQSTEFFKNGVFKADVAIVMTSPPNDKGFVSLGCSNDYTMDAVRNCKKLIVQINKMVPETYGDTFFHISKADRIVESDHELKIFNPPKLDDKELAIGEYCASLIPDRATVCIGIGTIPDAVCYSLKNKHDLGVFTDMFSDGMMNLFYDGIITNKYCATNPGLMVTSFVMGTRKLYDFVDRNPKVMFRSAEYVSHPFNIAKQSNMCVVNSAVGVDLTGQVVSASIGSYQLSGVGGQPSLIRGTALAHDRKGKGIIAMTSSVMDMSGKMVSKITPFITHGSEVTMSREDVQYIITENGIAYLKGKSLEDRSRALINIADPQFKDELIETFEKRYKCKF